MRAGGVVFLIALGCSTTYVPKGSGNIRNVAPPGFAPKGAIAFVNAQPSTDDFTIGKSGSFEPVVTNLHEWTDVVIRYAQDLVKPTAGIVKSISVKIVGAKQHEAQSAGIVIVSRAACEVNLEVFTATGYQRAFHAEAKAVLDSDSACEDATKDVTAQMFQDFQILKYLSE
jgi:hypothetical protein